MASGLPKFKELPEKLEFARMEEQILAFWKDIDAFQTSVKKSEGRPVYTFFDGPPFATGLPHYGHILAGTIKDVVCRYAHQTGHHVERRFGWDCHGLPIEFEIEKALGIKSSHDVQKMGIAAYNAECRKIVMRYSSEWETIVGRTGRWIDFKNDYKTLNLSYMESVWWVFKELFNKGLVYRGFKVMPYSTGCTTPLSNFECNMNYKDTTDPSATISFPIVGDEQTHFLAWTTTPWTLPSNLALVVHPEFDYIKVKDAKTGLFYIFAECRLGEVYKNYERAETAPFEKISIIKGADLVGTKYVPLFAYFAHLASTEAGQGAFRVVADKYVTSDSGTGIVHTAPGFGEDDFRLAMANGIIDKKSIVCPVDENGCYTDEVVDFKGRYVKDCDNDVLDYIKRAGRLVQKASITHSYPFCWRSETPLIYRAIDAWFVNVESFRDRLLASNSKTYWVPDFVKSKRFSNWLEDAKDWNVSRNRYFGTPLPVWVSEDFEEVVCVGSVAELEELSGRTGITDIHREFVDDITIPSKRPGRPPLKRVTQVFDCWFESGAMPYAQSHYPFENKEAFAKGFPADFIAEGLDQTRGWFYTLMVLSTALFDSPPFKNLIVNGLVLAEDGKKMSKSKKNYPPVTDILDLYGADATRLFLINSPVVRAEPLRFRESGVKEIVNDIFLPLANALKFFVMNANRFVDDHHKVLNLNGAVSSNEMDRWILAASQTLIASTKREMEAYRLYTVVPALLRFLEVLTNWYVRMNRRRLKGFGDVHDWEMSLTTFFRVLSTVSRVIAPFTPFFAETMHQTLKPLLPKEDQEDSVHYLMIPAVDATLFDDALERAMSRMINVIEMIRVLRERIKMPVKVPARQVVIIHPQAQYVDDLKPLIDYIAGEVNAFEVVFTSEEGDYVVTRVEANLASLGKKYKKEANDLNKALKALTPAEIREMLTTGTVQVLGKTLDVTEDVKVIRNFREGITNFETNTDGQVLVLVDQTRDEEVIASSRARQFVSRVQQLRKAAGLQITDVVDIYYTSKDVELLESLTRRAGQVNEAIKCKWMNAHVPEGVAVIAEEKSEIDELELVVKLTKAL